MKRPLALLVNELCGSRRCICRNLLVPVYIEVFMHHVGVSVCSFVWNLSNLVNSRNLVSSLRSNFIFMNP